MDDLDAFLEEQLKDPQFARAYAEVSKKNARMLERPCRYGNCTELYDPETGESDTAWGPISCPCQE